MRKLKCSMSKWEPSPFKNQGKENQSNEEVPFLVFSLATEKIDFCKVFMRVKRKYQICAFKCWCGSTNWQNLPLGQPGGSHKIHMPSNPAIPLLGILPKPSGTFYKNACALIFIAPLFVIRKKRRHGRKTQIFMEH